MTESECIFCKISKGDIPSKKVYEDENYLAFLDANPKSKGHTLVIPKKHYETFLDMPNEEERELFGKVQEVSKTLKEKLGAELIFLLVMGEEVPHTHVHLIPHYGEKMPFCLKGSDESDLDEVLEQIKQ
ncbi:MAG: HIT domain-containing protein [Candidatus Undinarchaeales archaeon]